MGGGSITIPAGKTVGLFSGITGGTLVVDGALNVELGGYLPETATVPLSGNGPVNVKAGGSLSVGAVIPAGLTVNGGELRSASPVPGTLSTLWSKVSSGQLTVTASYPGGPIDITGSFLGTSKNKRLEITAASPHGSSLYFLHCQLFVSYCQNAIKMPT